MNTSVISVVGRKNSGKTTFITRLIPELKKRGYKIGTIKHDAHEFEIDKVGKDSWKHKKSGANQVLIVSESKLALIKDVFDEKDPSFLIKKYFDDVDIVIIEGYKKYDFPKIEVFRSDISKGKEPLFLKSENLLAIVSDVEFNGVYSFRTDRMKDITDLIEKYIKEVN